MRPVNGVWIAAIVLGIAGIAFVAFFKDGATKQPPVDQQATAAGDTGGQQADPYKQDRAQAMSAVRDAYFAAGCKVFTTDAEVLPLVNQELTTLNEEAEAHGITDTKLQEELTAAGQDGATKAQRPGECDYWSKNPDAALAVRRAVREASEP